MMISIQKNSYQFGKEKKLQDTFTPPRLFSLLNFYNAFRNSVIFLQKIPHILSHLKCLYKIFKEKTPHRKTRGFIFLNFERFKNRE